MEWINLHASTLDSDEFLGSDPTERATWICLLRYCIGQENGGRIVGAADWSDRKWQQIVRVTAKEARAACALWTMEGKDLVVWSYPIDRENEVKKNREDGKRGGRPPKGSGSKRENPPVIEQGTDPFDFAETEGEGEGKGKGREGEARERATPPHSETPTWKIIQAERENKAEGLRRQIADHQANINRLSIMSPERLSPAAREKLEAAQAAVRQLETEILNLGVALRPIQTITDRN